MQNTAGMMDPQALVFANANSSPPRIAYFISRTNGTLIPLIPADELPNTIRLQGLPRVLRSDQTYGMQYVGMLPYTGSTFKLENENIVVRSSSQPYTPTHSRSQSSSSSNQFLAPDALARQAIANSTAVGAGPGIPQHALPQRPMSAHELATTHWRKIPTSTPAISDKTQAVIDAIVGATQGADAIKSNTIVPPPSGHVPDQDKKEFCTYWIRTGECDYAQQGCLYKHEMPDPETLKAIGFRGTPRWWIEKNQKVRMSTMKPALSRAMDVSSWRPGQNSTFTKAASIDDSDGSSSEMSSEFSQLKDVNESTKNVLPLPATLAPAPTTPKIEQSAGSGDIDLIDFDVITPPLKSQSASTDKASPAEMDTVKRTPDKNAQTESKVIPKTTPRNLVFVPKGEDPEAHIAAFRKRNSRQQTPGTRTEESPPLQKQIQSLQKSKYGSLMASKHAAATFSDDPPKGRQQLGRKRVPKRDRAVPIRSPEGIVVNLPGAAKGT